MSAACTTGAKSGSGRADHGLEISRECVCIDEFFCPFLPFLLTTQGPASNTHVCIIGARTHTHLAHAISMENGLQRSMLRRMLHIALLSCTPCLTVCRHHNLFDCFPFLDLSVCSRLWTSLLLISCHVKSLRLQNGVGTADKV